MFLTVAPERYSAPPQEIWTMPSLSASAKPRSAAFRVCEEVTLIAGYANAPALARSSISAYTSGVAIGMVVLLVDRVRHAAYRRSETCRRARRVPSSGGLYARAPARLAFSSRLYST